MKIALIFFDDNVFFRISELCTVRSYIYSNELMCTPLVHTWMNGAPWTPLNNAYRFYSQCWKKFSKKMKLPMKNILVQRSGKVQVVVWSIIVLILRDQSHDIFTYILVKFEDLRSFFSGTSVPPYYLESSITTCCNQLCFAQSHDTLAPLPCKSRSRKDGCQMTHEDWAVYLDEMLTRY